MAPVLILVLLVGAVIEEIAIYEGKNREEEYNKKLFWKNERNGVSI